jgi:hypothetical protein
VPDDVPGDRLPRSRVPKAPDSVEHVPFSRLAPVDGVYHFNLI